MPDSIKSIKSHDMTRRCFLKLSSTIGIATTVPLLVEQNAQAASVNPLNHQQYSSVNEKNPRWVSEARIGELIIPADMNKNKLNRQLSVLVEEGVSVVKVDSGLARYLSNDDFRQQTQRIKEIADIIQSYGLKVMWYVHAFKVITTEGVYQLDSFAREHADWLQVSFDGKERGVFYGEKAFQAEENDEVAWLCPCSPYREWFKKKLQRIAKTGIDGIWLDVSGQIKVKFPCSCHHCQKKFTSQTGFAFPDKYDLANEPFWKYVSWRHKIITRFLSECQRVVEKANSDTQVIAEMGALDHTDATFLGAEARGLKNTLVAWNVKTISEETGMAGASYDEWIALYNIYKCCRGTMTDNPSWLYCYGHDKADVQLVVASAIAAQNNPYALSISTLDSSAETGFCDIYFNWIKIYSKQIFHSVSAASVAVIYSERNRDFLDIKSQDEMPVSSDNPEYLEDYRGLSAFFYQYQIPADIYPFSRVDEALLARYSVLVLPFMASISKDEKLMLLGAVRNGAVLILTGNEQGMWDDRMTKREHSLWYALVGESDEKETIVHYGRGKLFFWKEAVGKKYFESQSSELTDKLFAMINQAGVDSWLKTKQSVVIQPYVYQQQLVIHALNYSWVGRLSHQPNRLSIELSIPWQGKLDPINIVQTEPDWKSVKVLAFKQVNNRLLIPLNIGINALVLIDLA